MIVDKKSHVHKTTNEWSRYRSRHLRDLYVGIENNIFNNKKFMNNFF